MDFLESRHKAAECLQQYAASLGTNLGAYRDDHDVFSHQKRWIDFWMEGAEVGYHLRGEVGKPPNKFVTSSSSFRGVWDEAGAVADIGQALELFRSWLIEAKEVDDLTHRMIHRSMM